MSWPRLTIPQASSTCASMRNRRTQWTLCASTATAARQDAGNSTQCLTAGSAPAGLLEQIAHLVGLQAGAQACFHRLRACRAARLAQDVHAHAGRSERAHCVAPQMPQRMPQAHHNPAHRRQVGVYCQEFCGLSCCTRAPDAGVHVQHLPSSSALQDPPRSPAIAREPTEQPLWAALDPPLSFSPSLPLFHSCPLSGGSGRRDPPFNAALHQGGHRGVVSMAVARLQIEVRCATARRRPRLLHRQRLRAAGALKEKEAHTSFDPVKQEKLAGLRCMPARCRPVFRANPGGPS